MAYKIQSYDGYLNPYEGDLELRIQNYKNKKKELTADCASLVDFANGEQYYGLHKERGGYVLREWAPAADQMYVFGDFNEWNRESHPMTRIENGSWEIHLKTKDGLKNGQKYKLLMEHKGVKEERIPSYANYVVQDPETNIWSAEVHVPARKFTWHDADFKPQKTPYIYECHIGMATEDYKIGSYAEFTKNVLPKIVADGYNTIQIMAIMEHPYYASFGYQVSSFFAASSRYGVPEDLKKLVDAAHKAGIAVLLDVVHSHAVTNVGEGLNYFDGTEYQYFHEGGKGYHSAWGTRLFNYGKNEVLHFLLSNLKYWMSEYHFDGFRFDGVTSMLYLDHGLGSTFDHYDKYFSMNTDIEAVTYLMLANDLVHSLNKNAITIAEDMSGMPGMCLPIRDGGIGFDYRLAMGVPDMWIRLLMEVHDEDWNMWQLWNELTSHRPHEKVIGYCESHDQALVGDKTIMFRLCDQEMYWSMDKASTDSIIINRGVALHKMIRLITFSLAESGYLNFMGNEFGHPEWIDFPREGNDWSYHYCRRQWSLEDNKDLKYHWLGDFDKAMLQLGQKHKIHSTYPQNTWVHQEDKVLIFSRNKDYFAFNFHATDSFTGYFVPVDEEGEYEIVLDTDDPAFGGFGRNDHKMIYKTEKLQDGRIGILAYLPSRTAIVFRKKGRNRK